MVMLALALSEDSSLAHCRKEIMQSLLEPPEAVRAALKLDEQMLELARTLQGENSLRCSAGGTTTRRWRGRSR